LTASMKISSQSHALVRAGQLGITKRMAERNVDCEAKYALSSLALQFADSIVLKA